MIQNSMKIKSNELRIYSTKVLIRKFVFACLGVILINFFPLYSAHAERSSDRHDEMVFDYGCEGNAVESCWITASGIITQGTAERFRNFLESGVEGMYITLASPGGNLVEGVRMGRLIREYGFFTNIMEECLSACAYAFLGGKNRRIGENSVLGFHQFSSNLELPELVSQQLSAELLKYVIEMGVDARVFVSASMTSPDEFFYVDEALGSEFGILSPNLFSEINVDIRSGVIFAFSDRQIPLEPYDRSKRVEFYCTDEIYYISLFADRIEGSGDAIMPHSSHFPAWVTPGLVVVDDKSHGILLENIDLFNRRDEYEYRFMIDSGLAKEIYSGSTIYIGFWRPRADSSDIRFNLILNDIERDRIEGAYTHCASGSANILDTVYPNANESASSLAFNSFWDHNGSRMGLVADGSRRQFYYAAPRAALVERGVQAGTLLFEGERRGNTYVGEARIFARPPCGEFTYPVEGPVSSDQRSVTMFGRAPRVNERCQVTSYRDDTLVFTLE